MVAVILVGALFSAVLALLVIRFGTARVERQALRRAPVRERPVAVPVEVRLIPRRLNPIG